MGTEEERQGYMQAEFEQIKALLCDLKPIPALMTVLTDKVSTVVEQVRKHDATLYGEKQDTGLVGRVDRVESKLNQVLWVGGIAGTAFILWIVDQVLRMIHP